MCLSRFTTENESPNNVVKTYRKTIMNEMRSTFMCSINHTNDVNLNSELQSSACLLQNNIPANLTMMAQIGKGCSSHGTINQTARELVWWVTSKWLPVLPWPPRERSWWGPANLREDKSIFEEMLYTAWRQAAWDVRPPVRFLSSCVTATLHFEVADTQVEPRSEKHNATGSTWWGIFFSY